MPPWVFSEVPIRSAKWLRKAQSLDERLGPVPFVEVHLCMMSFHLLQAARLEFFLYGVRKMRAGKCLKVRFVVRFHNVASVAFKVHNLIFVNDAKPLKEFIMNDEKKK